jgi:predicted ATPase
MSIRIEIKNFKALLENQIDILPLTVLCGLNNVGKSSLIQAIMLLRSAAIETGGISAIPLNGIYGIEMGRVGDIFSTSAQGSDVIVSTITADGTFLCRFRAGIEESEQRYLSVTECSGTAPLAFADSEPFRFVYLCAERNGPRNFQSLQSNPRLLMGIGSKGEYCADVLAEYEFENVDIKRVHPSQTANTQLRFNLELWLREFFPNITLQVNRHDDIGVASLRFGNESLASEWRTPNNAGFGISYALPILLVGLLVPCGGMMIVENPEAHLHPSGQSRMGNFLATVAATGVIVLVETHSDHILNGIRLACVDDHPISRKDVCIYNFMSNIKTGVNIESIFVTETGNLTSWPKSFFDQAQQDLLKILRTRK